MSFSEEVVKMRKIRQQAELVRDSAYAKNNNNGDCEITRNCPVCKRPLRKQNPEDSFICDPAQGGCGWRSEPTNGGREK